MPEQTKPADETALHVWLQSLPLEHKDDLVFELQMLLRGLDRFFHIQNLPLGNPDQAIAQDFAEELAIVHDFVKRIVKLSSMLLDESRRGKMPFVRFMETTLLSDVARSRLRAVSLQQETPDDSLFLLQTAFTNIDRVLDVLVKKRRIEYPLFVTVGNLISREVVGNRYFTPAKEMAFTPEFDRIDNRKVARIVRRIADPTLRRTISVVLLAFYRLLRYLEFIEPRTNNIQLLKSSLLIFSLVHSESRYLIDYFEQVLPKDLEQVKADSRSTKKAFATLMDSLTFQLGLELKKITRQELAGAAKSTDISALRGSVENSHGILTNFFQTSIVEILTVLDPHIRPRDVFGDYTGRVRLSLKLRLDLWVMLEMMDRFEEMAETNPEGYTQQVCDQYLLVLKQYIEYLKREAINLLRYDDYREVARFVKFVDDCPDAGLSDFARLNEFIYETKLFKVYLETTIGNINNRGELRGRPVDVKGGERLMREFLAGVLLQQPDEELNHIRALGRRRSGSAAVA